MSPFVARHVRRSHSIQVPLPPQQAFELFTPVGEKLWVPGWDPTFCHPADGSLTTGGVFLTDADSQPTIWHVLGARPEDYHARYLRVTPGSRVAEVQVDLEADGDAASVAHISYTFTALSEEGNAYVEQFTEAYYRDYIESWRPLIEDYLGNKDTIAATDNPSSQPLGRLMA